jgi:hypothetical protein
MAEVSITRRRFSTWTRAVGKAVASVVQSPFSDQAFFDSAEDDELFIRELSARIAHNHLFDDVRIDFHPGAEDVFVSLEPAVIEDILIALFEEMAARGCRDLEIRFERESEMSVRSERADKSENILLLVDARDNPGFDLSAHREEYFRLTMAHQDVMFRKASEYGGACFAFAFRAVHEDWLYLSLYLNPGPW